MEVLAACHIHSNWSYDGSWPLKDLATKFSKAGCRVLMMTEHDRGFSHSRLEHYRDACAKASTSTILLVPGIEYSDASNRTHVLVWGTGPFLGEGLATSELLEAVEESGAVAVLAHPSRKDAWRHFEPRWADKLLGIEVWNRKYDGWAPSVTAPGLLNKETMIPFVGLDFHTWRQSFPLTMALDLDRSVSEENILLCLKTKRCRAQALGISLLHPLLHHSAPMLRLAERGRQTAASVVRSAMTLSVKTNP